MQIVLLLVYILHRPAPAAKKRKRDRPRNYTEPYIISPVDNPESAIELLVDRLSVWQAVAELGIGVTEDKGKGKEDEDGMPAVLRRFWREIIVVL